ncbi:hypothetical protein, partial [Klebsiella pneumoniae]|uniref:hypothetical protein n=1 Tax=Klebsiella pneumoniae TaxID=573 RepID=UPI001CA31F65
ALAWWFWKIIHLYFLIGTRHGTTGPSFSNLFPVTQTLFSTGFLIERSGTPDTVTRGGLIKSGHT